jgi:hypothetical protein
MLIPGDNCVKIIAISFCLKRLNFLAPLNVFMYVWLVQKAVKKVISNIHEDLKFDK